jgi:hypothetical protein
MVVDYPNNMRFVTKEEKERENEIKSLWCEVYYLYP